MRNVSATPREEGFAKQTQVMLLGGWSADDVTAEAYPVSIKLESLLRRYSWKKVPQIYTRISYLALLSDVHFGICRDARSELLASLNLEK